MRTHIALTLAILCTSVANSQQKTPDFYLSGGLAFPGGPSDFTYYWGTGFNLGAGFGLPLSSYASFAVFFDYNNFGIKNDMYDAAYYTYYGYGTTTGPSNPASILTLSGNLRLLLTSNREALSPFVLAGVGYFNVSTQKVSPPAGSNSQTDADESESALTILVGLGAEFPLSSKANIFLEGRYALGLVSGESIGYVPLRLGVRIRT